MNNSYLTFELVHLLVLHENQHFRLINTTRQIMNEIASVRATISNAESTMTPAEVVGCVFSSLIWLLSSVSGVGDVAVAVVDDVSLVELDSTDDVVSVLVVSVEIVSLDVVGALIVVVTSCSPPHKPPASRRY